MKIDCIVPHMDDHIITIIGRLERDDWSYNPTRNEFETLKSENISELSRTFGVVRYYQKRGSLVKSISVQINSNSFVIRYEFAFVDDFMQIPSYEMRDAIKATIKKMLEVSDPAEKDRSISLTALNWIKEASDSQEKLGS
jgi:hypothetical protein